MDELSEWTSILPEQILLSIFNFYPSDPFHLGPKILNHVCHEAVCIFLTCKYKKVIPLINEVKLLYVCVFRCIYVYTYRSL